MVRGGTRASTRLSRSAWRVSGPEYRVGTARGDPVAVRIRGGESARREAAAWHPALRWVDGDDHLPGRVGPRPQGLDVRVPDAFAGERNVVIVPCQPHHQRLVDPWVPWLEERGGRSRVPLL